MIHFSFNVVSWRGEADLGVRNLSPTCKVNVSPFKAVMTKGLVARKKAVERPHISCLPRWIKYTLKYESLEAFSRLSPDIQKSHFSSGGKWQQVSLVREHRVNGWQALLRAWFHTEHFSCTVSVRMMAANVRRQNHTHTHAHTYWLFICRYFRASFEF